MQQQRDYYAKNAAAYESMHVRPGDEHFIALEYACAMLGVVRASRVLDVGSGTGRVVRFLRQRCPAIEVDGVEPVSELREQALAHGTGLHAGSGEKLPFEDNSYDVVTAFGVMHHVAAPDIIVAEMARVARRGVMISDANRFGQGHMMLGLMKLLIHKACLWGVFEQIRTRGRGYLVSDGDGIYYSYSIFDSVQQVKGWADRVLIVPIVPRGNSSLQQLSMSHGLLVALREPSGPGWAGL